MVRCHLPPRGAGTPRSFISCAMALMETKPALRSLRIVGPRVSARTSAARLIGSATRLSILTTVLRCQRPPRAVGIPLRFNSPANSRWVTKPPAMSCRMVEAKAAAREFAARLLPEGPRPRGAVSPWVNSIGPSWPDFGALSRQQPVLRLCRRSRACSGGQLLARPVLKQTAGRAAHQVDARAGEAADAYVGPDRLHRLVWHRH